MSNSEKRLLYLVRELSHILKKIDDPDYAFTRKKIADEIDGILAMGQVDALANP